MSHETKRTVFDELNFRVQQLAFAKKSTAIDQKKTTDGFWSRTAEVANKQHTHIPSRQHTTENKGMIHVNDR